MQTVKRLKKWRERRRAMRSTESPADRAARLTTRATLWMALFTAALAVFTAALSVVSYLQFSELKSAGAQTDKLIAQTTRFADAAIASAASSKAAADAAAANNALAKASEIANLRAWIGPSGASLVSGAPKRGTPAVFKINYQNTGREPAEGFLDSFDVWTTVDRGDNGLARQSKDMKRCMSTAPKIGADVAYPTSNAYTLYVTTGANVITNDVVSGRKILVIQGCFVYETADKPHHSTFCYFFKSGFSKPNDLNICNRGSYAD